MVHGISGGHQASQGPGAHGIPKVAERGGSVQPREGSKWESSVYTYPGETHREQETVFSGVQRVE